MQHHWQYLFLLLVRVSIIKYNISYKILLIVLLSPALLPGSAQYLLIDNNDFPHQLCRKQTASTSTSHTHTPGEETTWKEEHSKLCFLISVPGAVSQCMSSYYRCCLLCLHTLPQDLGATCSLLVFAVSSSKVPLLPATEKTTLNDTVTAHTSPVNNQTMHSDIILDSIF